MPTYQEYEQRILGMDQVAIRALWQAIEQRETLDWDPGKALEYLIVRAFQLEGAEVLYSYSVSIEGEEAEQIDGIIYTYGLACIIECKDSADRVNVEPIAKMRNQLLRRPSATIGAIFSRSGFTDPALTLAQFNAPQTILLWDADEIDFALKHAAFC